MDNFIGVAYIVIGGFVAGRVFIKAISAVEGRNEIAQAIFLTALAWLCWPLAWGILRASSLDRRGE